MEEILAIIKHFMLDVKQWLKFGYVVQAAKSHEPDHKLLFKLIGQLYELFPEKTHITEQELLVYFKSKCPSHKNPQHVADIVKSALAMAVGPEITIGLLETMVEKDVYTRLAGIISPVLSNKTSGTIDKARETLDEYYDIVESIGRDDALQPCDTSWSESITLATEDTGLRWPVKVLNTCIPVKPKLGLIFARPNVGKTSLAVNCMAYFAAQFKKRGLGEVGLYLGNEEGILEVRNRYAFSLLSCTEEWAKANPKLFEREAVRRGADNVIFHGGIHSTRDVEQLVKRYKPVVCILDQLPKFRLPGKPAEKDTERLRSLYEHFRDQAQVMQVLYIGLCQADFKGANKPWITTDNINASKTDVPGELDWAVGVGAVDDLGKERLRFINVCKNKGRMGRGQVNFDPDKVRYTD